MNEANTSGSDTYLTDGEHELAIELARYQQSRNPNSDKEASYIVEFRVLKSSTIEPGKKRTWVCSIPAKQEGKIRAYGDIRAFLVSLAGSEDPDLFGKRFEAAAEASIGSSNPLRELVAKVVCQTVKTKTGGTFTKHKWQPSDPAQGARVLALGGAAAAVGGVQIPPGFKAGPNGTIVPA